MAKTANKPAKVGAAGATKNTPPRSRANGRSETARSGTLAGKDSRGRGARRDSRTSTDILAYNAAQSAGDRRICDVLVEAINRYLPDAERKIWHRHPVWFLDGNPIVGYHKLKDCIRLLFWSGRSFDEPGLAPEGGFKTAGARYTSEDQISAKDLKRWLEKSVTIQWDYKNIVKRKGKLVRLK